MGSISDPVLSYGLTTLPRDPEKVVPSDYSAPTPVTLTDVPSPFSPLSTQVDEYARKNLPTPTYNHSMRVYHYGMAIKNQYFKQWPWDDNTTETYFLTCLLHDIGATKDNIEASCLSFEFHGGFIAMNLINKLENDIEKQAESVAEAIIRHQDLGKSGNITTVGFLLQLATILDNIGEQSHLVHHETIEHIMGNFPRLKWSSCFTEVIDEECTNKPWAHTTKLGQEEFKNSVLANDKMNRFE